MCVYISVYIFVYSDAICLLRMHAQLLARQHSLELERSLLLGNAVSQVNQP